MGRTRVIRNGSAVINLPDDALDNGWEVIEGKARHYACNAGSIIKNIPLNVGTTYNLEYEIEEITSGYVNVSVGSSTGPNRTVVGKYVETLTMSGTGPVSFFSNGGCLVSTLIIYEANNIENGITLAFSEDANRFVTYYSYQAELLVRFKDKFFAYSDGQLWQHNVNETRNNFFGVQYSSKIIFVSNPDPQKEKLWFNIRLDSKGNWSAPKLTTPANDLFPIGQESRLKKGNFKLIDGKLWADILRDKKDPKFASISDVQLRELESLFKGRFMQGAYLIVELECADTTEAKLLSAEVYYTEIERSI